MGIADMLSKVDDLEEKADKQLSTYRVITQPTEMHRRLVSVLVDILNLASTLTAQKGDEIPPMMRAWMRTIKTAEPIILEEIATVDEDAIREFISFLRDRLDHVIEPKEPVP